MLSEDIIKELPKILRDDILINEICKSVGGALDEFEQGITSFTQQLDINNASWSVPLYEKELGIKTNVNKPITERRDLIKARIRGNGKVGASDIKRITDSWTYGDVDVEFDGRIVITFNSIYGIPSNMSDLTNELKNIIPSHLPLVFVYRYLLFDELDSFNWIFDSMDALGLTWDQLEAYKGADNDNSEDGILLRGAE